MGVNMCRSLLQGVNLAGKWPPSANHTVAKTSFEIEIRPTFPDLTRDAASVLNIAPPYFCADPGNLFGGPIPEFIPILKR